MSLAGPSFGDIDIASSSSSANNEMSLFDMLSSQEEAKNDGGGETTAITINDEIVGNTLLELAGNTDDDRGNTNAIYLPPIEVNEINQSYYLDESVNIDDNNDKDGDNEINADKFFDVKTTPFLKKNDSGQIFKSAANSVKNTLKIAPSLSKTNQNLSPSRRGSSWFKPQTFDVPSRLSTEEVVKKVSGTSKKFNENTITGGYYYFEPNKLRRIPYVIIPTKLMLSNDFSMEDIFNKLDLDLPSIIFQLNRLQDSQTWNVRLPKAREKLAELQKKELSLENGIFEKKEIPNNHHLPVHNSQIDLLGRRKSVHSTQKLEISKDSDEIKKEIESLKRQVIHYQGVLRENCKRLLRGTLTACLQAKAMFRVDPTFSPEFEKEVFTDWLGCNQGYESSGAAILGFSETNDFHEDVWNMFAESAEDIDKLKEKEAKANKGEIQLKMVEFKIDETKKIEKNLKDVHKSSKKNVINDDGGNDAAKYLQRRVKNSYPNRAITHLIISDNIELLELKISESLATGLIVVNGNECAASSIVNAIQCGNPVIALKYTGGAADMACEMLERVPFYLKEKQRLIKVHGKETDHKSNDKNLGFSLSHHENLSIEKFLPYIDVEVGSAYVGVVNKQDSAGHYMKEEPEIGLRWLKRFTQGEVESTEMMNVIVENWPDRFNPLSTFVVDMFTTTEDDVQDRITQTMAVVFEAEHELGGQVSEQKRLTYAWRVRHKFVYNASIFRYLSDVMMILITIFTMFSTGSAVLYTFFQLTPEYLGSHNDQVLFVFLKLNLLLPLIATVFRGIYSSVSPNLKYIALKNASVRIESEIYMYRTKVGKYSSMKKKDNQVKKKGIENEKKEDESKVADSMNPSKLFSNALDQIWLELSSSDLANGSLRTPFDASKALDDVNDRINSNIKEQRSYLTPLQYNINNTSNSNDIDNLASKEIEEGKRSCFHAFRIFITQSICCCFQSATSKVGDLITILGFSNNVSDDGIGPMTADVYVRYRIVPMAAYFTSKTPALSVQLHIATVLGVLLSVASSALSTFGLSVFIPAVLALSGSITAWLNYKQVELRLMQTNAALNQLNQLLVWWDGLTMIEKRVPSHKETLVKLAEAYIHAQATIFSGGSAQKDDKNDKGEGKKE